MEKGPQYINLIWKRVHNILDQYRKGITSILKSVHNTLVNTESVHNLLVQYGKWSTQYISSNTEKGPQYITSIWKCPQYISSIWKKVHNICDRLRENRAQCGMHSKKIDLVLKIVLNKPRTLFRIELMYCGPFSILK